MIGKKITLIAAWLIGSAGLLSAQGYYEDDIYFNPSKNKDRNIEAAKKAAAAEAQRRATKVNIYQDYPGSDTYTLSSVPATRSIDEYNRRGVFAYPDSVAADSVNGDNFEYTRRIERFYNPEIVVGSNDTQLTELYYMEPANINIYVQPFGYWGYPYSGFGSAYWGWYDPWYTSWYNPWWGSSWWGPSWSLAWGPSWSWGWGPSWSWGWGPSWSWGGPVWGGPIWSPGPSRPSYNPRHPGATRPVVRPGNTHGNGMRPGANLGNAGNNSYRPSNSNGQRPGANGNYNTTTNRPANSNNGYSRPGSSNNNDNSYSRPGRGGSSQSSFGSGSSRGSMSSGSSRGGGSSRGRH